MLHLSAERLAALADESPTAEERLHLAGCAVCCAEREAHRRVTDLAAATRFGAPAPITDWSSLSARLRDEGLMHATPGVAAPGDVDVLPFVRPAAAAPRARRAVPAWAMRAAAAVLLVAGGVIGGRMSAGAGSAPQLAAADSGALRALTDSILAVTRMQAAGTRMAAFAGDSIAPFRTMQEAIAALTVANRVSQQALAFLAANDSSAPRPAASDDPTETYRTRLAALDAMMSTTRRALAQAPHDPVINQYYMATAAARERTLREIDDALPASSNVTRF
jgi:hypothetical protein